MDDERDVELCRAIADAAAHSVGHPDDVPGWQRLIDLLAERDPSAPVGQLGLLDGPALLQARGGPVPVGALLEESRPKETLERLAE